MYDSVRHKVGDSNLLFFLFFVFVSYMSICDCLYNQRAWITYFDYRVRNKHLGEKESQEFFLFIRNQKYLGILDRIVTNGFSVPCKKRIQKIDSAKKRIVYTFPQEENYILKLLTYLLIRKYDSIFSSSLYSFRVNYSVKQAFQRIVTTPNISQYYTYKVDISDYFNSIDLDILLPRLRNVLCDDQPLYDLIEALLKNPSVVENGEIRQEKKGVMAGCPIAAFLANVYLLDLDRMFAEENAIYCRYSDDIIIFTKTEEDQKRLKKKLLASLDVYHLKLNTTKEVSTIPNEPWTFLGLKYVNGQIDVSDIAVKKIKAKMRRKARALIRWKNRNNRESIHAVKAFIKAFNKKFYNNTDIHDMTWSRWYFPLITTDNSLKIIDQYMQECIRYIATETHTKSQYNFRYTQMKELGYQSLVNNWYRFKNDFKNEDFRNRVI